MSILLKKPTNQIVDNTTQWISPTPYGSNSELGTFNPTLSSPTLSNPNTNGDTYKTKNRNTDYKVRKGADEFSMTEQRPMPNVRPWVDVLNYALANRKINQIEKEQLARKNTYLPSVSLSIRPVQDLSPEILAAQDAARSQVRSEYAGSDPAMNLIGKNTAAAKRGDMYNQQIAGRAQQLMSERARWDQQNQTNQQMAGDTAQKNAQLAQDYADYKTGARTAALSAKENLNASFLSQIGMNLDKAAQFNLQTKAIKQANERQRAEDLLRLAGTEGVDADERAKAVIEANKILIPSTAQQYLTFNQAQALAIDRGPKGGILDRILGLRSKQ